MIPSLQRLFARICALWQKPRLDAELDEELALHLELATQDHIRAGCSPEEAERKARIALGGLTQVRELHRETRALSWVGQAFQDLKFATRVFRRERSFCVVSLLILAIGVGLNTAVFSLINTVLLRPLPFAEAKRLVWIYNGDSGASSHNLSFIASRVDTWEGLQETSRSLEQIEAYNPFSVRSTWRLTSGGEPESVMGEAVSPGLFPMLGIRPLTGRLFLGEDAVKNAPQRVILSHQLWKRRFGGDPHMVGQVIQLNGAPAEVIGIMPQQDNFAQVVSPALRIDFYFPLRNDDARNWSNTVALIGRMKPGVQVATARTDLALAVAQLKKQYADRNPFYSANVAALDDWVLGELRKPLLFLWAAAGFVLAIVGFTFGGLLLARGMSRRKEIALRFALGAGKARIFRQLLTESFTLTAAGAALGTVLASGIILVLRQRTSVEIPLLQSVALDGTALGFTLLLCVVTAFLCSLSPAWNLLTQDQMHDQLKDEGRGSTGGVHHTRMRSLMVIGQIGFACLLVILAGLMTRSFLNVLRVDWGFKPTHLLALRVDPVVPGDQHNRYLADLVERVRGIPGIEAAALTDCIPIERDRSWGAYPVNEEDPKDQRWTGAHVRIVTPGLFHTMGTQVLAGRDFDDQDLAEKPVVVVINQTMARRFWPKSDAVGRSISSGRSPALVIGVVQDTRHSGPEVDPGSEMYLSSYQVGSISYDLMIRTQLPPSTVSAQLRQVLRERDPSLPIGNVRQVSDLTERALSSRKLLVTLIGTFAAIALGLAFLGVYGLISYTVLLQTKEIGIRMALGAAPDVIRSDIVLRTLKLALIGIALGLIAAFASAGFLRSLLFGVSPIDPLTFLAVVLGLLLSAFIAGFIPALRASLVNPLQALRDG